MRERRVSQTVQHPAGVSARPDDSDGYLLGHSPIGEVGSAPEGSKAAPEPGVLFRGDLRETRGGMPSQGSVRRVTRPLQ